LGFGVLVKVDFMTCFPFIEKEAKKQPPKKVGGVFDFLKGVKIGNLDASSVIVGGLGLLLLNEAVKTVFKQPTQVDKSKKEKEPCGFKDDCQITNCGECPYK
jgi:hypothetical protein